MGGAYCGELRGSVVGMSFMITLDLQELIGEWNEFRGEVRAGYNNV